MGNSQSWLPPRTPLKEGTTLCEMDIYHIRDAHNIIGVSPGGFTPLVLCPMSAGNFVVSIPEGFVAIVTSFGAPVDGDGANGVWLPGFHSFKPYYKVARLITTQMSVFDTPVRDCKTKDNVTCSINVLIMLSIQDAYSFVYKLGPEKLDELMRAQQEESIRQMASATPVESIYDLHGSNTDWILEEMNRKFAPYGVKIHSFTITNVKVPQEIADSMEEKTLYSAQEAMLEKKQNYEVLMLNNGQNQQKLRDELQNDKEQNLEKATTMKVQKEKEVAEIKAESQKEIQEIQQQQRAEVEQIKAESELEIANKNAERYKIEREFAATAQAEAQNIRLEATLYEKEVRIAADLEATRKRTEGRILVAESQGKAAQSFEAIRSHDLTLERLKIFENLAKNKNITIHSSNENVANLVPDNSLVNKVVLQGMEAIKLKCGEWATAAGKASGQTTANRSGVVQAIQGLPSARTVK